MNKWIVIIILNLLFLWGLGMGLVHKIEVLEHRVNLQQKQIDTYKTLIFNLYGKNGG